jgi:hypothetical protein
MKFAEYSGLVDELSKEKPDHLMLRRLCQKVGIRYSKDLIHLMAEVLAQLAKVKISKQATPSKQV